MALITGTAGVGKTTLAIRFARQAAARFPDGQLYVNLRGFDPASAPVPPAAALQGFFDALGVPPRHVPAGLDAQSALLRTLLDEKRLLLLLDNAHDADQVRPLLPGSPGCLAVVTSRSQLTGLVVDGARPLSLGVLDADESAELLARRLGAERVNAEPAAIAALVERTAGLPLALERDLRAGRVPAGRGAGRPGGRTRRRAGAAGRVAHRRGGNRPASRLLLVGGQAERGRGEGVPAAQPAPGSGHLRPAAASLIGAAPSAGPRRAGRTGPRLAAHRGRGRAVRLP